MPSSGPVTPPRPILFHPWSGLDSRMVALLALIFLALYGYELFQFTFSIDEEYASSWTNPALNWLSQGRWGMALVSGLLPPIWAMPFLSTALFGLGLIFAAPALANLFGYAPAEATVFCVVFSLSPIWPHIVEFSTLSYGVGIGLITFSLGSHLMFQRGAVPLFMAVVLLSFTIAIYQTFAVLGALVVVNVALRHSTARSRSESSASLASILLRGGVVLALAILASLGTGVLALRGFGLEIHHIQGYVRVGDYFHSFEHAFTKSLDRALGFVAGTNDTYLDWGLPILALPALGLAVILWDALFSRRRSIGTTMGTLVLVAAAGIISVVPFFFTAGETPARALVWFPLLFAMLSAATLQLARARLLIWILLGVNILAGSFISNALFYSDKLAREQDRVVAYDLFRRIEKLRRAPLDQPIPFTLVGAHHSQEPVRRVEVFGASFFGWDEGNVFRAHSYLHFLGARGLRPIDIADAPGKVVIASASMPSWPAPESVAWIGEMMVVKLSPMTHEQRYRICRTHKEKDALRVCQ